jgi:inner membrane protein
MSVLGHVAIGVVVARRFTAPNAPSGRLQARLLGLGALAIVPDCDLILQQLIPSATLFQHRGATHSLTVALLVGLVVGLILLGNGDRHPIRWGLIAAVVVASHGLMDAFGQSDLGVELLWPFSDARYLAPWHILPNPALQPPLSYFWWGPLLEELILYLPLWVYAFLPRSWLSAPNPTGGSAR